MSEQANPRNDKRARAKAYRQQALEKAARARRLRQAMIGAGVALAVAGVGYLVFRDGGAGADAKTPDPVTAVSTPPAEYPPLPAGADPALKTKPKVDKGSGKVTKLKVTTLIEGKGPAAAAGNTLVVNYVGVLYTSGEEFDASWNSQRTFPVQLGQGMVIPGWDQGLLGVKEGSRVQLDIPADLAYGENAQPPYPAGALRFVVDVLSVR